MADRFRALYPGLAIEPTPALPGAARALDAVRAAGGRSVVVTAKYGPNAQLHLDRLELQADAVEGWRWAEAKGEALREHGATVYVGDHAGDMVGAHAAGAVAVGVATGGTSAAELEAAGADIVLESLEEFPAWLDEHLLARSAGGPAELAPRAGLGRGRLQRGSGLGLPARRRGPRDRPVPRRGGHRGLRLPRLGGARGRPGLRRRPGRPAPDAADLRDGPRRLPRQRRGPVLLLQGRAPRRAAPRGRPARRASDRHRHQRRRRRRRVPTRDPRRRRAGGHHPAARRRAHQGADPGGVASVGASDLGQAPGRVPVEPGRLRHRDHPGAARPRRPRRGRAARGPRHRVHRRARPAGARSRRRRAHRGRRRPGRGRPGRPVGGPGGPSRPASPRWSSTPWDSGADR